MEHHNLDIQPIPKKSEPLFINEPAAEENAMDYSYDIDMLISQIEIYDQIWFVRHNPNHGRHSMEAVDLVKEFVKKLEEIQVYDAERFPYDTIDELKKEYLDTE